MITQNGAVVGMSVMLTFDLMVDSKFCTARTMSLMFAIRGDHANQQHKQQPPQSTFHMQLFARCVALYIRSIEKGIKMAESSSQGAYKFLPLHPLPPSPYTHENTLQNSKISHIEVTALFPD